MYHFNKIVGQKSLVSHLQQAIASKQVSHAYIIEGEAGMGKKLIASTFAKTLQCVEGGKVSCDTCESCVSFEGGNHPDIHFVTASKKSGYGVDDIREQVNGTMFVRPYNSPYKIYIIDQADTLTVQAQNALLKTIEEPPVYGIVIFLVENSRHLLETILSRCVKLALSTVTKSVVSEYLIDYKDVSVEEANIFASFSRGNIGKALQLLEDEDFKDIREKVISIMDHVIEMDTLAIMIDAKDLEKYKGNVNTIFDIMLSWLRDLMVLKSIRDEKYIIHMDKYKSLLLQSQLMSYNVISVLIERIQKTKHNFKLHANYQLSFETLLMIQETS